MIEFDFDDARRWVRIRFAGTLEGGDASEIVRDLLAHPRFRTGMNGIADLREVDAIKVFGDDVRARVETLTRNAAAFAGARWAIVAHSEAAYGIGRQFELMTADAPFHIRAFRDIAEAERWLEGSK